MWRGPGGGDLVCEGDLVVETWCVEEALVCRGYLACRSPGVWRGPAGVWRDPSGEGKELDLNTSLSTGRQNRWFSSQQGEVGKKIRFSSRGR